MLLQSQPPSLGDWLHQPQPVRGWLHPPNRSPLNRSKSKTVAADVLHGHGTKGGAYARLASVPGSRSVIRAYTPRGGSYNYRPGSPLHRLYMGAESLFTRRTDVFLFRSEYVAGRHRTYVDTHGRVSRIVHNGLSEAEFAPVTPAADPFDLLYVGELREAKGLPILLQALSRLRAEGPSVRLLMVGSGADAGLLQAKAEALGLTGANAFEPAQAIRSVVARGRIMVVTSFTESLAYVVLEAAAAAQPLVATDVGSIPEIFGSAAGDLVPARDPIALQRAIGRVLDEAPANRAARFRALSDSVRQRFSMEQMTEHE